VLCEYLPQIKHSLFLFQIYFIAYFSITKRLLRHNNVFDKWNAIKAPIMSTENGITECGHISKRPYSLTKNKAVRTFE